MAKQKEETVFLNPFDNGVTYPQFMDAKGKESTEDYCKDHLTSEQIEWLVEDLKNFTK